MIGQTISHYRILDKLGEGGMGVVYKAQDTKLDRLVALKFLSPHLAAGEKDKQRFINEAKAASALDHPNICTIHEIGETPDGQVFIAMACYEGETLQQKITKGALSLDDAIICTIQIAEGLHAAHKKGIVHRDIKSSNIMVTTDGQVKIMDFGLARSADATLVTKIGPTVGTVPYMSPEQARGEKVDHRTDIWSLGVVMYEMICRRLPFESPYSEAVVYSILNEELKPFSLVRSDVPAEVENIVRKCLQKNLTNRYQHARELLDDLHHGKRGASKGAATQEMPKAKGTQWRKRYFVGGAAVVVAVVLFFAFPLMRSDDEVIRSIAVLPLENLSEKPEQEYFVDGMTDALISDLAKIKALRVISRTSIIQYKNARKPLPQIARELNVDAIVEGTVLRAGNRVRITAQLIEAETDKHLWSESYERDLRDIFKLQADVARAIVKEVKITLTPHEERKFSGALLVNEEAYDLYLKGRYFWNKRTQESSWTAVKLYEEAIRKDSSYPLAYSAIADCYVVDAGGLLGVSVDEAEEKARKYALRALRLDSTLAEPRGVLAQIRWLHDWDLQGADEQFERALEFQPNEVNTLRRYAYALVPMKRYDDAISVIEKAYRLDPLSFITNLDLSILLYITRRYDEAIVQSLRTLEMDSTHAFARSVLANSYWRTGKANLAEEQFKRVGELFFAYLCSGREREARNVLEASLKETVSRRRSYFVAQRYAALGLREKTLEWLEKSYAGRSPWLIYLSVDPLFDRFRFDPEFTTLLRKIGLGS